MNLDEATRKRITELAKEKKISLTALCLNAVLTPSTVFDFMKGRTKTLSSFTVKKNCYGAGITLSEFYNRDYFNDFDEVVQ